jgi:uncharacterized protein with GYD domain
MPAFGCTGSGFGYNAEQLFEGRPMSLDIPKLVPQLEAMAQTAAERAAEWSKLRPQAVQALDSCAKIQAQELENRIAQAGSHWRGAEPTDEPVNRSFSPPALPDRFDVIGADGSQIEPDRHRAALFFLINIGSIKIAHGSGDAPQTASHPRIFYQDEHLYLESEALIHSDLIAGLRDLAEMEELARLAEGAGEGPTLVLLDNGLLLWLALQEKDPQRKEVNRIRDQYLLQLQRLKEAGAAVAGFIDRPRSANVLRLLHLATLPPESIDESSIKASPYRHLTDRFLFSVRLAAGQRSARFKAVSPLNRDFERAGQGIQFFYLNTGYHDQIARVEIPDWVAENEALLDLVHAGVVEQCRTTGIPYALARAHELAVVAQPDRQALEQLISGLLIEQGLRPQLSQKAKTKQWTGRRRSTKRSLLP